MIDEARLQQIRKWIETDGIDELRAHVLILSDALRLSWRRECPGLEEHDALQHMSTRALRAEAEVERLHEEDSIRTKEHNILVRENRMLRAAAEAVLRDTHKITRDDSALMWAVHDITMTELRVALDTSAAVRTTDTADTAAEIKRLHEDMLHQAEILKTEIVKPLLAVREAAMALDQRMEQSVEIVMEGPKLPWGVNVETARMGLRRALDAYEVKR